MADLRQSDNYSRYLNFIGWETEVIDGVKVYIKKIPIFGYYAKIQRQKKLPLEDIEKLKKKFGVFQTVIEPSTAIHVKKIISDRFVLSKSPHLPTKTIHLDLTKTVEEIYSKTKKDTRYSLRKTKDLRVYDVDKVDKFRQSWKESVNFQRHVPSTQELSALKHSFGDNSAFLVTPSGNAGAIFLVANKTGYYWQAFTSKSGRRELAQYKIVWAGINWAKSMGATTFDFEGIYDERFHKATKRWKGFSHFKKAFGGVEVKFPGAFVKTRLPLIKL